MTKETLAKVVDNLLEFPKPHHTNSRTSTAYKLVGTILSVMTEALLRGEKVEIQGFGRFSVATRPATRRCCYYYPYLKKKGLHREIQVIPARKYIKFQLSRPFKRMINE